MTGFQQVFGGTTIAPSNATFLLLNMAADVDLAWPIEQAVNGNVVADTIEVVATTPGLNIDIPDARQVSTGYTALFNNTGVETVSVRNAVGGTLVSLVSGTAWVIYLQDNSTAAGVWRVFQLGASVSVTNAAALAGAGLKAISTTLNARIPLTAHNTNYVIVNSDRAILQLWTGGVGAYTLPNAATVGADWFCQIRNSGSGDLTVTPPSGLIDGAASKTFPSGASSFVVTDGVDFFTLGFGTGGGGGSGFDFIVIAVPGSGNYVLSGAELNKVGYRFTGILTGTRNIVVPGAIEEYWVDNQTTGAFSLFVKTVAQVPGVEILQSNRNILYCDGTNVLAGESATVSFPIPVAQGGTGAVTAAAARTNLGATAVGSSLFTAVDAAAARTAILAVVNTLTLTAGNGLTGGGDLTANRSFAVAPGSGNVGYLSMPTNTQTGSYTLVAADAGKCVSFAGGGVGNIFTLPNAIFQTDEVVTIKNKSTGSMSLTPTTTLTWLSGSGAAPVTGTRVLSRGGVATLQYLGGNAWDLLGGVGVS